jgi:hypothetical protein
LVVGFEARRSLLPSLVSLYATQACEEGRPGEKRGGGEAEQFLDECDKTVEEALATHFGLHPASEAFSAALCSHADRIEARAISKSG